MPTAVTRQASVRIQRLYCAHAAELSGLTTLPDGPVLPLAFACRSRRQSFESPFEPEFPLLIVLFVVFGSTIAGLLLVVPFVPPLPLPLMLPDPDIVPVPDRFPLHYHPKNRRWTTGRGRMLPARETAGTRQLFSQT